MSHDVACSSTEHWLETEFWPDFLPIPVTGLRQMYLRVLEDVVLIFNRHILVSSWTKFGVGTVRTTKSHANRTSKPETALTVEKRVRRCDIPAGRPIRFSREGNYLIPDVLIGLGDASIGHVPGQLAVKVGGRMYLTAYVTDSSWEFA